MINVISYGDRLSPGIYEIHSRFKNAINFVNGELFASIVNRSIGAGPLNIVIDRKNLDVIDALSIEQQGFRLNGTRYNNSILQRYESQIECENVNIDKLNVNLDNMEESLIAISSPKSLVFLIDDEKRNALKSSLELSLVNRFDAAVKKIFSERINEGVELIRGAGFGYTPSGDDFISGMLIAFNLTATLFKCDMTSRIAGIYKTARGMNPISNALLLCSKEGSLFETFKKMILSLLYRGKKDVMAQVSKISGVGETSGCDMSVGFLLTMRSLGFARK